MEWKGNVDCVDELSLIKSAKEILQYLSSVEYMNNHFIDSTDKNEVTAKETLDFYLNNTKSTKEGLFVFSTVSELSVLQAVESVKSSICGHDFISFQMLKLCCLYIIPVLSHTVNCPTFLFCEKMQ